MCIVAGFPLTASTSILFFLRCCLIIFPLEQTNICTTSHLHKHGCAHELLHSTRSQTHGSATVWLSPPGDVSWSGELGVNLLQTYVASLSHLSLAISVFFFNTHFFYSLQLSLKTLKVLFLLFAFHAESTSPKSRASCTFLGL